MGIAIDCKLCGKKTHRQIKEVPICVKCKDDVYIEQKRMKNEMITNIKDISQRENLIKYTTVRYAIQNLINKVESREK